MGYLKELVKSRLKVELRVRELYLTRVQELSVRELYLINLNLLKPFTYQTILWPNEPKLNNYPRFKNEVVYFFNRVAVPMVTLKGCSDGL